MQWVALGRAMCGLWSMECGSGWITEWWISVGGEVCGAWWMSVIDKFLKALPCHIEGRNYFCTLSAKCIT